MSQGVAVDGTSLDRAKIDSAFEPKYPVDWYNRTKADKLTSNLPQIYKELSFFQTPLDIFVKIFAIGACGWGYFSLFVEGCLPHIASAAKIP
jgi:hypothetical protein